jgi:hypothetical protein
MWSAAVFEPAFPARSTMASGSPSPWPAYAGEQRAILERALSYPRSHGKAAAIRPR